MIVRFLGKAVINVIHRIMIHRGEVMKKRKIILLISLFILLGIIVFFGEEIGLRIKIIATCYENYHDEFWIDEVYVNNDEREIYVSFNTQVDAPYNSINTIFVLYEEIFEIVYVDNDNKWGQYSLNFCIKHASQMPLFQIVDISKEKTDICISASFSGISISDISKLCPEVSELSLISLEYEELSDFDDFTNLKYFSVETDILDIDERKYILSLFPNCELHWRDD